MSAAQRPSAEEGVATVWTVGLVGVLLVVTLVGAGVAALVGAHRQAQAAADLAALAGAVDLRDGGSGCGAAAVNARHNHARLVGCHVEDRTVEVEVEVRTGTLVGPHHRVRARALAGPSSSVGGSTSALRPDDG